MLTLSHSDQLDEILGLTIAELDIPDDLNELAVSRYSHLGYWFEERWSSSPTSGLIHPQGSFLLGTVVQPVKAGAHYDIDLVCVRDYDKDAIRKAFLKDEVGGEMRAYIQTRPAGTPRLSEGKRCWTLAYAGEPFHMDVLPAIPNVSAKPHGIWITDTQLARWQSSNPRGFGEWFRSRMRTEFDAVRGAISKQMDIEDVPDWKIKTTLQRAVQALKRHRDLFFPDPANRPASIIITTLAARAYQGDGGLYEVLLEVSGRMPTLVETRDGEYRIENPVNQDENFADRWVGHPTRADNFFRWIEHAHADFTAIGAEAGTDAIVGSL
ncbi:MAG: nucleotidyltransferase, partial [Actinomycetota bacterium]